VNKEAFSVLPRAFQAGLIADAQVWDQVRTYRNLTSHTYDEAKAIEVAAFVRATAVGAFDELQASLAGL
jgi:nucleotidyltransferase substrate binding protein (TIGR01987 family)